MRLSKILLFLLYVVLLAGVSAKLFFEDETRSVIQRFTADEQKDEFEVTIGLSEPALSNSPLANDSGSRARLLHMYEGLTRVTPDLSLEPALAISYGVIDETTWEFRMRPGVQFHHGQNLTFEDIEGSILSARDDKNSGLSDLAATIKTIEKKSVDLFHISTVQPDPVLPAKLSSIFIFKTGAERPSGTGPYRFVKESEGALQLERFESYWSKKAAAKRVWLDTFASRESRVRAISEAAADIVQHVPPDVAAELPTPLFELKTVPSLEINMVLFRIDRFSKKIREAIINAIDRTALTKLGMGFARPAYQFVPSGVFGFNIDLAQIPFEPANAESILEITPEFREIKIDFPLGLEGLGGNIKRMLERVGFAVDLRFHSVEAFQRAIQNGESDVHFFGWRFELGDALDFLTAVAHSKTGTYGQFNSGGYSSARVDTLIEWASREFEPKARLTHMRQALKIITNEDMIGIPLFSLEMPYAVSKRIRWKPRADGYILAQEIEAQAKQKK